MLQTVSPASLRHNFIREIWPACNAPIVGTKPIFMPSARFFAIYSLRSLLGLNRSTCDLLSLQYGKKMQYRHPVLNALPNAKFIIFANLKKSLATRLFFIERKNNYE
jgi:hypothetical protein